MKQIHDKYFSSLKTVAGAITLSIFLQKKIGMTSQRGSVAQSEALIVTVGTGWYSDVVVTPEEKQRADYSIFRRTD